MQRQLKITEVGDFFKRKTKPQILLTGAWLAAAGFAPNARVNIEVRAGELVLTPINPVGARHDVPLHIQPTEN